MEAGGEKMIYQWNGDLNVRSLSFFLSFFFFGRKH
jgi:hypothetical protein